MLLRAGGVERMGEDLSVAVLRYLRSRRALGGECGWTVEQIGRGFDAGPGAIEAAVLRLEAEGLLTRGTGEREFRFQAPQRRRMRVEEDVAAAVT